MTTYKKNLYVYLRASFSEDIVGPFYNLPRQFSDAGKDLIVGLIVTVLVYVINVLTEVVQTLLRQCGVRDKLVEVFSKALGSRPTQAVEQLCEFLLRSANTRKNIH